MAARKHKTNVINLLPQEEFAASTVGRILTWLLSTFRIIVIVSEMVVMGAFLSRFWLDARNTDLSDEIQQKQVLIASFTEFEKDFRATQKKLSIFKSLVSPDSSPQNTLQRSTAVMPTNIQLVSFSIVSDEVQIRGTTANEQSIQAFITNLENADLFKEISLSQASISDIGPSINFTLKGTLKGGRSGS